MVRMLLDENKNERRSVMNKRSKLTVLITSIVILVLLVGVFAVVQVDNLRRANERKRIALYEKESYELLLKKQDLLLEHSNIEKYTLNRLADASYLGIVFTELDEQLFDYVYPMFCNRQIPLVGTICLDGNMLPGGEGLISRSEFDKLTTEAGWDYALYWDGEGILRNHVAEMKDVFERENIAFPDIIVFSERSYAIEYDEFLKSEGFRHVIHHGEGNLPIIDRSVDGTVWHPGMISWNTVGVSNDLLSSLINDGGIAMFEVNFSGGNEILFDYLNTKRVEAFGRMLGVLETCSINDELVVTDIENAREGRLEYIKAKENHQEAIAKRKSEILIEIDELDAKINEIYNKYIFGD